VGETREHDRENHNGDRDEMKKTMWGFAAAVAALVVAGSAGAQVCAGFPTTSGQGTLGALVNFPPEIDQYGAEGSYNLAGPLAVNAGFLLSKNDAAEANTFRGGLAFELPSFTGNFGSTASICPNVRADYTSENGVTVWTVPIGLGVGASVPLGGPDLTLSLYIIPALVWNRFDHEIDLFDETETNFGARSGFDLNFNRFFLGATSEWLDFSDGEAVVGLRAGIKF
jgi:hypothetical protein